MEHGIIDNWTDMEKVWQSIYEDHLYVQPEEHPVLLTEAPLNPIKNRTKTLEIFFEKLNVPAMFISLQAVLSLYASGRTTGVVVDSGDGVSHVVPIYDGFAIEHAITRSDVAGRDVTRYLQQLLRKEGVGLHTSAEFQIVREIKEKMCFLYPSSKGKVDASGRAMDVDNDAEKYRLPDGEEVSIAHCRHQAPEVLFKPDLIGAEYDGIHNNVLRTINECDRDLRDNLMKNIILSGGTTTTPGFGARLTNELHRSRPGNDIKVTAPKDRLYSTWVGGSILASLSTFKQMWISHSDYDEYGVQRMVEKLF
ncbi:beta-centractin [Sphaeroforma arctica JP610]|uniref:Beta-centractin n=1 Tax=Sphaeroforma arctica JP610 TaxID=667725 RepID=A0A0L0G6T9_9EUKA|nr:beta-centractin [Sphaeroforma arctica JP610]KNC84742.1 beta-centractin [Sphaeroforma arctica JP610]|eukprot:XP_014158644.1 beta-centractin [Sphaeroforma arctica JP610]